MYTYLKISSSQLQALRILRERKRSNSSTTYLFSPFKAKAEKKKKSRIDLASPLFQYQ